VHIGIVTSSLSRQAGGIYDAARFLAQYLNRLPDIQVTVFGLADEYTHDDLTGWGECPVRYFTTKGPKVLGYAPGLAEALNDSNVDIVHQHGIWTFVSLDVRRWFRKNRKPYLISVHGMLDDWAVRNSAWKKKLFAWFVESSNLRNAAFIHVGSTAEEKAVRSYGLSNSVVILPNGVEIGKKPERSFKKPDRQLLYLGRLHPKKGIDHLIDAWQRVAPTDWSLSLVGEGPAEYESALRSRIGRKPGRIEMPGPMYHDEKYDAYRNADAFILPSLSEGLPMVVLDAFAQGLPVLMTDACNLNEAFSTDAAIRIEPNVDSIETALHSLFTMTPEALGKVSDSGYSFAKDRFSWESIALEFRSLYSSLLQGAEN
jgi:glycosyltransferase involved in cell wall biosynthesis